MFRLFNVIMSVGILNKYVNQSIRSVSMIATSFHDIREDSFIYFHFKTQISSFNAALVRNQSKIYFKRFISGRRNNRY